jgi:hypothetical protein
VSWYRPIDGFSPLSRESLLACTAALVLFLLYAAFNSSGFLFVDHANLMIHEVGHQLFAWAGYHTMILGGTLTQLLVPFGCMLLFLRRGELAAVAVTAFWGFQNLLYIATYMADARRSALPLVGSDESDWTILFTHWGVIQHDLTIAAWTRGLGWVGMIGTLAWLVATGLSRTAAGPEGPYRRSPL